MLLAELQRRHQLSRADLALLDIPRSAVKALEDKGLVETAPPTPEAPTTALLSEQPLTLNSEQAAAVSRIQLKGCQVSLLDGATGSGNTEVYLQAIARARALGRRGPALVPESGRTPQTLAGIQRRFAQPVAAWHTGMNDRERLDSWLQARSGRARIIIGTRSAIFTPLAEPGIIIVDEEHDGSFKQQDGFRYSARDLAVMRAHRLDIPLVLGSATPALETLHNAHQGRYQHLHLRQRAGGGRPCSPLASVFPECSAPPHRRWKRCTMRSKGATSTCIYASALAAPGRPRSSCRICGASPYMKVSAGTRWPPYARRSRWETRYWCFSTAEATHRHSSATHAAGWRSASIATHV